MAIGFEKWADKINAEAKKGLAEAKKGLAEAKKMLAEEKKMLAEEKKMLAEEKKMEARNEARLKEMRELAKKIDSFKKEKSSNTKSKSSNTKSNAVSIPKERITNSIPKERITNETKQKSAEAKERAKEDLEKIRESEREERKERLKLRIASRQESEERLKLSTQRRMDSITPSYWFDNDKRYTFKFNRYASNYGEMASDDELKEVTKKIPIQDFRKKNSINLNDETKKTTDGFKDLNKQLDKINNKLNLFAVALSALKIFDIGMEKHKESQQNIHYGYGAGLNYRETRVFSGIAEGFGISKEGLYEEIGEWRRLKDRWGTGTPNLFANEEQQKFLLGNTPTSLGYTMEKLLGMNPVQIYEMVVKDLFLKMKANPSMAGAYEAHARASGFGNAGTLAFKGAMSGVSVEDFMKIMKNVVDTPFGREKSSFEFSTQLASLMSRLENSIDRFVMTFEKSIGYIIGILDKLPILSNASERTATRSELIKELKENPNSFTDKQDALMQKTMSQESLFFGNIAKLKGRALDKLGIGSSEEVYLRNILLNITNKDYMDNDFVEAKIDFAEFLKIYSNSNKKEYLTKWLDDTADYYEKVEKDNELAENYRMTSKAVKIGNLQAIDERVMNYRMFKNESEWEALHSQKNDVAMTYDSNTNANNGITIILEDKTRLGIEATAEYSNGVQTLSQ